MNGIQPSPSSSPSDHSSISPPGALSTSPSNSSSSSTSETPQSIPKTSGQTDGSITDTSTSSTSKASSSSIAQAPPKKSEFDQLIGTVDNIFDSIYRKIIPTALKLAVTPFKNSYDLIKNRILGESGLGLRQDHTSRELFKNAEIELIKKFSDKYFSETHSIIEIGAGPIPEGNSSLMQRLPLPIRKVVVPTEADAKLVADSKGKLVRADTLALEKSFKPESQDRIIGSLVLDSLDSKDLITTLKQCHTVLKDKGLIVHFSILEPNQNVIFSEHSDPEVICFPLISEKNQFQGIQVISKEDLFKFILTTTKVSSAGIEKVSSAGIEFLKWYAFKSPQTRELMITDMSFSADPEVQKARLLFSNWIKELNPPGLKSVHNVTSYQQRVHKSLQEAGFKILEFGEETCELFLERPKDLSDTFKGYNSFSLEVGEFSFENLEFLEPGDIAIKIRMHIIVAQKTAKGEGEKKEGVATGKSEEELKTK